jgi:hypothetical protein
VGNSGLLSRYSRKQGDLLRIGSVKHCTRAHHKLPSRSCVLGAAQIEEQNADREPALPSHPRAKADPTADRARP